MYLKEINRYPRDKVRSPFGLTHEALAALLAEALPEIDQRRRQSQADKPHRKRVVGGGRPESLRDSNLIRKCC